MASWDGGILDPIRDIGNDVSGFFNSTLGKGLAAGFTYGNKKSEVISRRQNYMPIRDDQGQDGRVRGSTEALMSEDFGRIEAEWMERLQKFAGLNAAAKDTEVRLG